MSGLISDLLTSIFLLPTLYEWFAGKNDVLPDPEPESMRRCRTAAPPWRTAGIGWKADPQAGRPTTQML